MTINLSHLCTVPDSSHIYYVNPFSSQNLELKQHTNIHIMFTKHTYTIIFLKTSQFSIAPV